MGETVNPYLVTIKRGKFICCHGHKHKQHFQADNCNERMFRKRQAERAWEEENRDKIPGILRAARNSH